MILVNSEHDVDFYMISFPSDRISLKDLRNRKPEFFDASSVACAKLFEQDASANTANEIMTMLYSEREIAQGAFWRAQNVTFDKTYAEDLHGCAEDLAKLYELYGLSSGPHQTRELIRGIESQAEAQARAHTGPLR